jgi:hypothetical protein
LSSNRGPNAGIPSDYSQNLDAQPEAFDDDEDNSDDDIGKSSGLNFNDDDDKNDDEELINAGNNELIELGSGNQDSQNQRKAAANIPKLSGPN